MQRLLSAVVFASIGVLSPTRANAQSTGPSKPASSAAVPARKPGVTLPSKRDGQLSEEAELARVAGLYEAGKYRECDSELARLLDPTGHDSLRQPGIVENARVYWAACLLGAGESEAAADAPLRAAIHENPQMKPPDSLVFPQPVVERFLKVRDSLVSEIRAAEQARILQAQAEARRRQELLARDRDRMRQLELLASEETIIYRNSRLFAFVPFGVGQFQNREHGLGYSLLVGEALLGSLSIAAIIEQSRLAAEADSVRRAGQAVDEVKLQNNQRTWSTLKIGGFWAFAALAVGGIVQAQLEFVPQFRETRTRKLPPLPATRPTPAPSDVSALPYFDAHGGGLNVVGRF